MDLSHFIYGHSLFFRQTHAPVELYSILWMDPIQIIPCAWKYAVGSFRYIDRWPTLISLESNKSLLATNLDLACFVVPFKSHPVLRTTAGRRKGWDKVKCHMVCHLFCVVILPRSGWINIQASHNITIECAIIIMYIYIHLRMSIHNSQYYSILNMDIYLDKTI